LKEQRVKDRKWRVKSRGEKSMEHGTSSMSDFRMQTIRQWNFEKWNETVGDLKTHL
jgi:hypothetical protein